MTDAFDTVKDRVCDDGQYIHPPGNIGYGLGHCQHCIQEYWCTSLETFCVSIQRWRTSVKSSLMKLGITRSADLCSRAIRGPLRQGELQHMHLEKSPGWIDSTPDSTQDQPYKFPDTARLTRSGLLVVF